MGKDLKEKKLTLEEYQKRYSKPENIKVAKTFLFVFAASIGVIVFMALFFVVSRLFEIHKIAGYSGAVIAVILYFVIYIIPLVKMTKTKSFIVNVDASNAKEAQRYNRELRNEIADKMIDFTANTEGVGWYSTERVGRLAIARQSKNDTDTKNILTEIYNTDVKNVSNKIIRDHALRVGVATALSQSKNIDTLFVVAFNLSLIKDIVFLYGYRPSDAKMVKIYQDVIVSSLIAYGLGAGGVSNVASKFGGKALEGIPFVGKSLGTIVDSVAQGIINSTLTAIIGFQTKKYLKKEYHLQDILDEIEIENEAEEQAMVESLKEEIKHKTKENKEAFA